MPFILYKANMNLPVVAYDPYYKIVLRIQEIKLNFISWESMSAFTSTSRGRHNWQAVEFQMQHLLNLSCQ